MEYRTLARKYRPKTFDEVVGQEAIAQTLKNAINSGKISHAYLFTGPRGVGKTTMARLVAKALNCHEGLGAEPCNECESCIRVQEGIDMDVLEIDGASNNRVEEIRTLRSNVQYRPARSRFKIYIIDEVHMLSIAAFNALLKTLEEPPDHVKFVFATTEPQKLPDTIISRCQRFDFRRLPANSIVEALKRTVGLEKLDVPEEVLWSIARRADGSLRDAYSILEQLDSWGERAGEERLRELLGVLSQSQLAEIVSKLHSSDTGGALRLIGDALQEGVEPPVLLDQLIEYFRNLLVLKCCGEDGPIQESKEVVKLLSSQVGFYSEEELLYILSVLAQCSRWTRTLGSSRVALELGILKLAKLKSLKRLEELSQRVGEVEVTRSGQKRKRRTRKKSTPEPAVEVHKEESQEWEEFYQALGSQYVEGCLRAAIEKVVEGDRLIIRFGSGFHARMLAEEKHRARVKKAAEKVFGRALELDIEVGDSSRESHESQNPAVRKALEIFKGRIVKEE